MDEKLLENAKYFAGLPHTDDQLDDILDLPRGTVAASVARKDDPLGRAIRAGRMVTLSELYESIQASARRHSTPAQQMIMNLWQKVLLQ